MKIVLFDEKHRNDLRTLYLASRIITFTWLDSSKFSLMDFDNDTQDELIWVAIEYSKLVGFISIQEESGFIHNLFVDHNYIKKGIGTELLQQAKEHFSSLSLKCLIKNNKAIGFYLKHDFVISSTVHGESRYEQYHLMKYDYV